MLLSNEWFNNKIKEEIQRYLDTNENQNTTTQNQWDRAILRGKFIAIEAYLQKKRKFLEIYNLPRLNQKETENLNRLNSTNETEAVIRKNKQKNCPTYKSSVLEGFTSEFAKIFKEE